MFTNFKKNLITTLTLVILIVPGFILASPFNSDPDLKVYPENETLNFQTSTNKQVTETFSIQNTSQLDKTIYVRGLPRNGFQYSGASYIYIPANSSSYMSVQFQSSTPGRYDSEITIQHNDTLETKTIKLFANVSDSNQNSGVTISKSSLNFGTQTTGSTTTQSFQINNNNNSTLNISNSNLKGPFKVIAAPRTLSANQSDIITVEFKPTQEGNYNDDLVLSTSDNSNQTINISLSGKANGKNPSSEKEGSLQLSSQTVRFNNISQGTSTSKTITVTNPNSFDVEVKLSSNLSSPLKAKLENSVNRSATIRAKSSKRLTVTFEPNKNQYYEDTLTLSTNLTNNKSYSIEIQANTKFRSPSTPTPSPNPVPTPPVNNPIPYIPPVYNSISSVTPSRTNLNPDLGEITYFQLNFGNEFNPNRNTATLKIFDPKLNQIIHTQSANNLVKGQNNWKLQWNGKNSNGNSVLGGNYIYTVNLISPSGAQRVFQDNLEVVRNISHLPQPIEQKVIQTKNCLTYTDVQHDSPTCDSIIFAKQQDLLKSQQTKFYPNQKVTRAQALSSLVKLFDLEMKTYSPSSDKNLGFKDLDTNEWIMPFIKTVQFHDKDNLILNGYTDTDNSDKEFKPDQEIKRAEFYKWMFEIANLETQKANNYLMDYYVTNKPFKDTRINSEYDWFTPYADITKKKFNNSNFTKRYFNTFNITEYTLFCPEHEISKKEFFETIYELHKTDTISFK